MAGDKPSLNEPTPIEGFDPLPIMTETGMTVRQVYFIEWYLITMSGAKAARLAGYSEPFNVAAHTVLNSKNVRDALDRRFGERKIKPSEILERLKEIAETTIDDFIIVDPQYAEEHDGVFKLVADGRVLDGVWIDIRKAIKAGRTGSIKSFKKVNGESAIELHDKTRALELLGKHYRLFADVTIQSNKEDGTADVLSDDALERIARQALDAGAAGDVLSEGSTDDEER